MRNPFRRRPELRPERPQGVRIVHADGTHTPCEVVRQATSSDGITTWAAIPYGNRRPDIAAGDSLAADMIPGRTRLAFYLPGEPNPADAPYISAN
jgi:hypothetical protein